MVQNAESSDLAQRSPSNPLAAPLPIFLAAYETVKDFGKSFVESAIERPLNGVFELSDHLVGALTKERYDSPKVDLVGDPHSRKSIGAIAGSIAGTAFSFYLLHKTVNINGGPIARSAWAGALYEGVLQPGDPHAKNFWADRVTNAAVGATTFGAMGLASTRLAMIGKILAPAALGSETAVLNNALSGTVTGLAHSQARAIFKEGRLATKREIFTDAVNYTAFGAAYGITHGSIRRLIEILEPPPVSAVRVAPKTAALPEGPSLNLSKYVPDQTVFPNMQFSTNNPPKWNDGRIPGINRRDSGIYWEPAMSKQIH